MKIILSSLLVILMLFTITLAHPGRTDSKGGHYNRSTGVYHYHHGYPEHQHTNGICPYNYSDKTTSNSNFTDNNISTKSNTKDSNFLGCAFLGSLTWALGIFIGLLAEAIYSKFKSNNYKTSSKKEHKKIIQIINDILVWVSIIALYILVPIFFYATFILPFYSFTTFDLLLNGEYYEAFFIIISTIIVGAIWTFINKSDKK